jgi:hypothetical protein
MQNESFDVQPVACRQRRRVISRYDFEQAPQRLEQYREVQPKLIVQAPFVPYSPPYNCFLTNNWTGPLNRL